MNLDKHICPKCKCFIHNSIEKHINACDGTGTKKMKREISKQRTAEERKKVQSEVQKKVWARDGYREWMLSKKIGHGSTGVCNNLEDELERKTKISEKMKGNSNWENSINVSGRGKKGRYKDYYFASSWELAYIIFNLENNIAFERNWRKFEYEFENKKHYYIPDFVLPDGTYVEIKGYHSKQFDAKQKHFKEKLIVIDKSNIGKYLKFAIEKNGKDFYIIS
jgi:hypothetical protein